MDSHTTYRFEPKLYPRIYTFLPKYRLYALLLSLILIVVASGFYIYSVSSTPVLYLDKSGAFLVALFIFLGAACISLYYFGTSFTLRSDSIEKRLFSLRKVIPRSDMALKRGNVFINKKNLYLSEISTSSFSNFSLTDFKKKFGADQAFEIWCMTLPDHKLSLLSKRKEMAAKQKSWGPTPENRYRTYKILRIFLQYLAITAIGLLLIGMDLHTLGPLLYSTPFLPAYALSFYSIMAAAVFLLLKNPDAYTLKRPSDDHVRISLLAIYNLPVLFAVGSVFSEHSAIGMDNIDYFHSKYWLENPVYFAICFALFFPEFLEFKSRKLCLKELEALTLSLLITMIGGGALMLYHNVTFDFSHPEIQKTVLIRKEPPDRFNRRDSLTFELLPQKTSDKEKNPIKIYATVGSEFYLKAQVGDEICIYSYPGALGIPWEKASYCPEQQSPK